MKTKLPEKNAKLLTVGKVMTKFVYMKKKFKKEFFSSNQESFPFPHERMNQIFTDYATKKLNESTDDSMINVTVEDIVNDILNEIDSELVSSNNEHNNSENVKLGSKISELPKDNLCIQKERMRKDRSKHTL